jgi:hypothetical protein
MSDHTGTEPTPHRDLRTCRERQDAAIAALQDRIATLEIVPKFELLGMLEITEEINSMRARIATLEAQHAAQKPTYYSPADAPAMSVSLGGTPGTSWAPGCAMDAYAASADGPGKPQDAEPEELP